MRRTNIYYYLKIVHYAMLFTINFAIPLLFVGVNLLRMNMLCV